MSDAKCSSCHDMDSSDLLPMATILMKLEEHPLWTLNEDGKLYRHFEAKNFQYAMEFIQQVGIASERQGHHPDIHITNYRNVELVLFTHSVNGITKEDFKLVETIDTIPVTYSKTWKALHPDLALLSSPKHIVSTQFESRPIDHEVTRSSPDRLVMPAGQVDVHRSLVTDSGLQLHPHEFRVHTGHDLPPGHSDILEQGHGHKKRETLEVIPISHKVSHHVWHKMAQALKTLKATGFDSGEAESYLPMIQNEAIHPSMEVEVYHFYKHLLHRLQPDWRATEPVMVVEAALAFVEGYEELKNIVAFPPLNA